MKTFDSSKFGFAVQSSGKGTSKRSINPKLVVTPTNGQIKINDATSRMLQIASRDNIVLLGNRTELENFRDGDPEGFAEYLVTLTESMLAEGSIEEGVALTIDDITIWGIAKGWGKCDKSGNAIMVSDRLTQLEKEALIADGKVDEAGKPIAPTTQSLTGFRVAANGDQSGIGHIMTGNDTANYALMGGDKEHNIIFDISRTPVIVPQNNGAEDVDVKVYPLEFKGKEGKQRNPKAANTKVDQDQDQDQGQSEMAE